MSATPSPLQSFMEDLLRGEDVLPVITDDNARIPFVLREDHNNISRYFHDCSGIGFIDDDENDANSWDDGEDYYFDEYVSNNYKYRRNTKCAPVDDNDESTASTAVSSLSSSSYGSVSGGCVGKSRRSGGSRWDSGSCPLPCIQESPTVPRRRYSGNRSKNALMDPCSFECQSAPSLPRRRHSSSGNDLFKNDDNSGTRKWVYNSSNKAKATSKLEEVEEDPVILLPYLTRNTTPKVNKSPTNRRKKTRKSQDLVVHEILDAAMREIMLDDYSV